MRAFSFVLFVCLTASASAQQRFALGTDISVRVDGNEIRIPFGVGINAAQFQRMDIDGNGEEEWITWDINARRVLVFSALEGQYMFRPEMAYSFPPDVGGFLVLEDYDGDGKKDLFTASPFGIRVYRNSSGTGSTKPRWTLAQNFLRLDNGSNLQANNLDVPLVSDLDGDGDLDIVTFNFASGDYLELYLNTSVERKGQADVDGFGFPESRWGNFEFCDCGAFSFGISCLGIPFGRVEEGQSIQHAGGHSVLFEDFDGDGSRDLLLGRDACGSLYYLPNRGTDLNPLFEEFSQNLPGYGELPQFPIFHTARKDGPGLVISSNISEMAAVYQADFSRNVFELYPTGSPAPTLRPFLQDQILDLGENSRPFFKGLRENGEMILTANSLRNGKVVGLAYRFVIMGKDWEMVERDYLGLSSWDLLDLQYLEYANIRGQREYWISGIDTVNATLQRRVWRGLSPQQSQMKEVVFPGTGIRPLDQIELFSYANSDFLLLARQTGELALFEILGDAMSTLSLVERNFLGFTDNPATRNLTVHVVQGSNPSMYFVDQNGILQFIHDFMNQAEREPIQVAISEDEMAATRLSRSSWITSIPEAFGSSRDLVLGNTAGGIEYLTWAGDGDMPGDGEFQVKVYPNPSQGQFYMLVSADSKGRLINSLGQTLIDKMEIPENTPYFIQYPFMAPGMYFIQFESKNGDSLTRKILIRQ